MSERITELLAAKIAEAEERMKGNLSAALYGGGKPRDLTAAQKAREPGYYWTRYPGQEWTLDEWGHGCWSYMGHDEISTDDPPEIIGPVHPPPP